MSAITFSFLVSALYRYIPDGRAVTYAGCVARSNVRKHGVDGKSIRECRLCPSTHTRTETDTTKT